MSENTVAIRAEITESKVMEYLDVMGITDSLLPNEKKLFFNIAREFGLNPFRSVFLCRKYNVHHLQLRTCEIYNTPLKDPQNFRHCCKTAAL